VPGYKLRKALIPAAGKGIRAYPKSKYLPKAMLEIEGRPVIENNILILRDQMGIKDIVVIVGHLADKITGYLGCGKKWGVNISYIDCPAPEEGLASGMLLAEGSLREPFVCVLGDEYYSGSNHSGIGDIPDDAFCVCAVKRSNDIKAIRKNYNAEIEDGAITRIIEKPSEIKQWNLGCGTYALRPEIFDWIKKTAPSPRSRRIEFMDVIDSAIRGGRLVRPFYMEGVYFNINTIEDVNQCNYLMRSSNFKKNKVSLVIPAHNEEKVIGAVINDFKPYAHEIIVVNNQSADNTAKVSIDAGAKVEEVSLKGYGDTIKYGLSRATGDILVITEADYSFRSKDLGKFLEYIKDADMVIGTRTTRQLIEQGANMNIWLLLGNLTVAKIIEILWWGSSPPRFTDVGCTYRVLWRSSYEKIRGDLRSTGPEFSVEMMIKMLKYKQRIVEIPISYYPRLEGLSKHSRNWLGVSKTALRMLALILRERFFIK
jgi:UDP-N-acetylglucosamine diphosphorylase / glucose-1-phosphate thymidylyltransferase / UDP-N-acetylgalactosamine diphosphorylase / glucosamine-1-phosphate N-acetyltransferase / galactosamine-1-phosphate N-acetyltransferase